MTAPRASLVVIGQVLVEAGARGAETAEAVGIADGRIVSTGSRSDVLAGAAPGARLVDQRDAAVIPGLHDFHLHLVGMARARREVLLDEAATPDELLARLSSAASLRGEWLRGRGWSEAAIAGDTPRRLEALLAGRRALLYSHDAHSAWASSAALRAAGLAADAADPAGGRLERDEAGALTGILRERATDAVEAVAGRLRGEALDEALAEVVGELASWGVTSVADAGDTSADNGVGEYAALGDRASLLLAARGRLDGRLRIAVGLPAIAIPAAAAMGIVSGGPVPDTSTLAFGWAKAYLDGALGSGTAALFAAYADSPVGDRGIVRLADDELDLVLASAREARIGVAMHAIGDRAVASALDALARATPRAPGVPPDRIEHVQLLRGADAARFAALDVTASIQPVHCASDRPLVERRWAGDEARAYPWRALADAGARLASGSDAPIESPNPWQAVFAAAHRRFPADETADWHPEQALGPVEALCAATIGAARGAGRGDIGHLRPGARADLAVLDADLASVLAADERTAAIRSMLTLVDGRETHRS